MPVDFDDGAVHKFTADRGPPQDKPLKIIDVIDHRNKYGVQRFIVLNRDPVFRYERKGIWLIAEDAGLFDFYKYERPSGSFQAFAGRSFDIPMKDGTIERAHGQWWHYIPPDYEPLVSATAYGTPESLAECNVFCAVSVDPLLISLWLTDNEASNNYEKYSPRSKEFGQHRIVSQWEAAA